MPEIDSSLFPSAVPTLLASLHGDLGSQLLVWQLGKVVETWIFSSLGFVVLVFCYEQS